VAAFDIPVRASRSLPSATAFGRFSKIMRIACMQNASVYGDAKMLTTPSSACVSASSPVSAVGPGGRPIVSAGSTIAMSGTRQ